MNLRRRLESVSHGAVVGTMVRRSEVIAGLVTNADAWQVVVRRCKVVD